MNRQYAPTQADKVAFWRACGVGVRVPTYAHFAYFAFKLIRIRSRDSANGGAPIPFVANDEQRDVITTIIDGYYRGEAVRVIVLKARQIGITTALQVLEYWLSVLNSNFLTMVMAHIAKSTANIAGMARGFSASLPPFAKRSAGGTEVDGGLRWPNRSQMIVMTQGGNDGSRSYSPNMLHISELGQWDKGRAATTAEDAMVAALKSLGSGNRTIAVIEATANGAAGSMYDRWNAAVSGQSGWIAKFYSWLHSSLYPCVDTPEDEPITAQARAAIDAGNVEAAWKAYELATHNGESISRLWIGRAVRNRMSVAQVKFALREIASNCNGDLVLFDQEMPLSPDLAFAASGRRVWPDTEVDAHPIRKPVFVSGPLGPLPTRGTPEERLRAAATPGDCIRVWEMPEAQWADRYALGSDVSAGVGGDSTTGVLVDRVTSRQVAEFCSNAIPPDLAAVQLARLGEVYGHALICWEANNHGNVLGAQLTGALAYPNLWRRVVSVGAPTPDPSAWIRNFGYLTNEGSRTALANRIITALRSRTLAIVSDRLAAEMRTWVFSADGRPDHVPGRHDDLLIAAGLALYASDQMSEPTDRSPQRRDPDRYYDDESNEREGTWAY